MSDTQYEPTTSWREVVWTALGRFGAERITSRTWFVMIGLGLIALGAIHTGLNLTGPESFWRRWLLYAHLPVSTGMFVRALRDEGVLP